MHNIIRGLLESGTEYKLLSFDVFDTVVTRKSGDHRSVFLILGQELHKKGLISTSPEVFARQRDLFEYRARKNNNFQEIRFRNIYKEMFLSMGNEDIIDRLMHEELQIEAEQIRAVPGIHDLLECVRKKYGRVIYVSDMYLPNEFMQSHLTHLGLMKPEDALYLSSEYGLQKRHGLFRVVLEKENLKPSELHHFGDSVMHDVNPARMERIDVHRCTHALEHPSETILNEHSFQTEAYSSRMAGASRLARLGGRFLNDDDQRVMWDTGASVTGPLVYLYAQWIIDRALQKGIKNLLFLARDAYFPYKAVCEILAAQPQTGLNAAYIYGSRFTYNALDIEKIGPEEWDLLTTVSGYRYSTLRSLQTALYCNEDSFDRHMKNLGFNPADRDKDRELNAGEITKIRDFALHDPHFNEDILRGISDIRDLTLEYFQGEADLAHGTALVDTGWTTNSHAPLYRFLKKSGCTNLRLFYIGLTVTKPKIPAGDIDTFMFNRSANLGIMRKDVYYNRPIESLLMSDQGRTRSFVRDGNEILPVLDPRENEEFVDRYFDVYARGVNAFLQEMVPYFSTASSIHDLRSAAEEIVSRFWKEPTLDEAKVWSKLDWEYDPLGTKTYPLARPYRISDSWSAFRTGEIPECYKQFWKGGAEKLTPKNSMFVIQKFIAGRKFGNRLYRLMPAALKNRISVLTGLF
jgi:FMN phosphatase YigB (HAD superfamily)